VQVVVGTHALLQSKVKFKQLGLVVIDEEQKFGVTQKEKLKKMNYGIDLLTLSATPIPRTLQVLLLIQRRCFEYYLLEALNKMATGKLKDISYMNSPPAGRKEIITIVKEWSDDVVIEAITNEMDRGGQVSTLFS
jgi:transcription-repair coupling factor (superfamily II helicase)